MADAAPAAPAAAPQAQAESAKPDPLVERESAIKQREEQLAKKERVWAAEQKKNADEKKGLGAKLKEYEDLKKWRAAKEEEERLANLNPTEFAKKRWGDNWHQKLTDAHVGGVPPADLIAAEFSKLRQEIDAKLAERDERQRATTTAAQQASIDESRRIVELECVDYLEASASEYPLFKRFGSPAAVAKALAQRIEQTYYATQKRDEAGNVVRDGRVMTPKEAADALEADLTGIAEEAVSHDKYKSKLQEKLKPATVNGAGAAPGGQLRRTEVERRTLSNDLTASTPGKAPPLSDEDRMKRATAAFNAARTKAP